jgi:disulfide bond formation protein DsbB
MHKLINFNSRIWFLLGFLGCAALLAIGAYLQFIEEQEPCPLCISQRIAILLTGIVFLIAAVHNPGRTGIKAYSILGALVALAGASISTRHVWLQHLPPEEVPECGPGLEYVFENFPLADTIKLMLSGTGDCAEVSWTLLSLSIPEWTLIAFLMLALLSLLQIWNSQSQ